MSETDLPREAAGGTGERAASWSNTSTLESGCCQLSSRVAGSKNPTSPGPPTRPYVSGVTCSRPTSFLPLPHSFPGWEEALRCLCWFCSPSTLARWVPWVTFSVIGFTPTLCLTLCWPGLSSWCAQSEASSKHPPSVEGNLPWTWSGRACAHSNVTCEPGAWGHPKEQAGPFRDRFCMVGSAEVLCCWPGLSPRCPQTHLPRQETAWLEYSPLLARACLPAVLGPLATFYRGAQPLSALRLGLSAKPALL